LENDSREISFELINLLDRSVSGYLEFDLPEGLRADPSKPQFGPIGANQKTHISVSFRARSATPGPHEIRYQVAYDGGWWRDPTLAQPQSLRLTIGPVLEPVYRGGGNSTYRIDGPRYTAEADMSSGLFRYLSDDEDGVKLNGDPLFTISDGKQTLLSEHTEKAFTWPTKAPAQLIAHAYDRCRWQALFFADRIMFRMARDWTQFERAYFKVPGKWSANAKWKTLLTKDGPLDYARASGSTVMIRGAELEFPGAHWNLCFGFSPAQSVSFEGSGLAFSLRSFNNDNWTVGFCRPDSLSSWMEP
jgi:hypothetical protein